MTFDLEKAREAVHILENFAFASGKITTGQIQDILWGARLLAGASTEIERMRTDLQDCGSYVGIGPGEGDLPIPERVRRCVNRLKETQNHYSQKLIAKDAEIERLRAENAGLSKAVIDIQEERDLAQAEFRAYHKAWEEQQAELARVSRLRVTEIDQAGASERMYLEGARLKDARIEELLAELTSANVELMAAGEIVRAKDARIKELDGMLDARSKEIVGRIQECQACQIDQLRAEGKIGPDAIEKQWDEVLGAKPDQKVWQITEERKAAIKKSAELFEEDANELESEEYSGAYAARQKSLGTAAVLRDMLAEATR